MALQLFTAPTLPLAPRDYDAEYFNQLVRALNTYFRQTGSTTPIVIDQLTLLALPTTAVGQRIGTVYNDGGYLKIVLANTINPLTNSVNLVGVAPTVILNGNIVPTRTVAITGVAPTITVA
jgi:hypothetical protein